MRKDIMQSLIDSSSAFYGAGNAAMRRQFKLRAGPYSGRKIVVYQSSASTIRFSYSDPPYQSWSTSEVVCTNSADYPCSGWLDTDGSVYLVYSVQTTLDLAFRKLTFNAGSWSVGSEVVVHDDKDNYFPSIFKDSQARLHVCWTRYDSGTGLNTLRYKRSTTDGAAWGAGPADAGTALTNGSVACYNQIVYEAPNAYCFYTDSGTRLLVRKMLDGAAAWDSEVVLYTGIFLSERLSATIAEAGGMVGVAFEAAYKILFFETDGTTWSPVQTIVTQPATPPLLLYNGAIPCVIYGVDLGTGHVELRYRIKRGAGFEPEKILAGENAAFAHVYLYDHNATPHFQSGTLEAANSTAADVMTTTSHAIVAAIDDAVYFGAESPFANLNCVLSTPGSGGSVVWEYFTGSIWQPLVPATGAFDFEAASRLVRFWSDSAHAPADWQMCKVEQWSCYWIRARVVTPYSTAPVGTQLTPCTALSYLNN